MICIDRSFLESCTDAKSLQNGSYGEDDSSDGSVTYISTQSLSWSSEKDSVQSDTEKYYPFINSLSEDIIINRQDSSNNKPKKSAIKNSTCIFSSMSKNILTEKMGDQSPRSIIKKKVSFSNLEIRTYNIVIGDNPGTSISTGIPISLCWEYDERNVITHDLDTFESLKTSRKSSRQLYISQPTREWMVSGVNGFTIEEINEALKDVVKVRRQRKKTNVVNTFTTIRMQQVYRSAQKKYERFRKKAII